MRDRIKAIMEAEDMTPARLADTLDIGRAVVSHILNGRNNPSLEVITRILLKLPRINSEWLLTGVGYMYKISSIQSTTDKLDDVTFNSEKIHALDLFSQIPTESLMDTDKETVKTEYQNMEVVEQAQDMIQDIVKERIIYKEASQKKIKQIIIYYSDNTFETFNAH